ncbi:ugo1p [Saccharomyces arboricola H-6]|uniref:Ugo1p n=1 Tax=Saccharomyces arboricola (strain H-6 / AS 2.3317 / CBS 10644) TaxID=1160507 RepID=J8Q0I4_SACAR|nr:ugo1p [Saccharomyces arboricola H-6]
MNNNSATEATSRAQIRPYYDPDSFNAGYSAVFKPEEGVVDPQGYTIASKLNVINSSPTTKRMANALFKSSPMKKLSNSINDGLSSEGGSGEITGFNNFEWTDLVNLQKWRKIFEQLLDMFFRKYFQLLIQQPFDVARLLTQVGEFQIAKPITDKSKPQPPIILRDEERSAIGGESDEYGYDEEEIDFFPVERKIAEANSNKPSVINETDAPHSGPTDVSLIIAPQSLHTIDVINALFDQEGIRGLWKANNTTFIINFLSLSIDTWFTGLLSSFLGVPDPYFMEVINSSDISKSFLLALGAGVFTSIILLPVDLIRTRLIVTSFKRKKSLKANSKTKITNARSLRQLIKCWSWRKNGVSIPLDMWSLTILQSINTSFFNKLFDLVIYNQFHIEKYSQTVMYNTMKFFSKSLELFIKLPVENLLRRCQLNYLLNDQRLLFKIDSTELIVKPKKYNGIWDVIKNNSKTDRGQLWNGWKVGVISLICGYGLQMMNKVDINMEQEKF